MDIIIPCCAGLDVHKKFLIACRRRLLPDGRTQSETRRFTTMTRDLEALAAWLAEWGCTDVALESTGVYWQPVYNVLEGKLTLWLVNAAHVKQVPGRKTDVADAAWLAQLLQHGLLKRSNIPPLDQRELRDLTRYRQSLVEERNRVANRLQKVLEDANLKLASVATSIQGVSAQEILRSLIGGETDPAVLAQLARGKLQKKQAELEQALTGRFRPHHRFLLTQLLGHLDFLDAEVATLEERIEELLAAMPPFAEAVVRLDSIPGINRTTALIIVAEIGVDMSRYPSERHLAAWAGLAPGNNQTGAKQRASKTRKGNRYLRRALVQAARAAARKKGSYLKAMYHRLAHRRGANRAAVAVARSLLQIAYHLIAREQTYQDLGGDYFDRIDRERTQRRLVQRLQALGFTVMVQEAERPAAEPVMAAA
jgi:transposase